MAGKVVYISGIAKWAKVYERNADKKYENWNIVLYPDKPSLKVIKDSGSSLEQSIDDDGTFYRFKRPFTKMINEELVKFGPPKVVMNLHELDENGVPKTEPFDKNIGNGSEVTIKVVFYDAGKHIGHRLEGVRIDKLVVFEGSGEERPASKDYPF